MNSSEVIEKSLLLWPRSNLPLPVQMKRNKGDLFESFRLACGGEDRGGGGFVHWAGGVCTCTGTVT